MCVVCRSLFVLFLFGHCVVRSSSIYGFCLPLWYLQTLLPLSPCLIYEICFPKSSNQNTIYFIGSPYDVLIGCFLDNEHNTKQILHWSFVCEISISISLQVCGFKLFMERKRNGSSQRNSGLTP